jgi:hypothetical protein
VPGEISRGLSRIPLELQCQPSLYLRRIKDGAPAQIGRDATFTGTHRPCPAAGPLDNWITPHKSAWVRRCSRSRRAPGVELALLACAEADGSYRSLRPDRTWSRDMPGVSDGSDGLLRRVLSRGVLSEYPSDNQRASMRSVPVLVDLATRANGRNDEIKAFYSKKDSKISDSCRSLVVPALQLFEFRGSNGSSPVEQSRPAGAPRSPRP